MPNESDLQTSDLAIQHTPARIRERLSCDRHGGYLADFVYGAIDGTVTTFAVVSGVAGAELPSTIIIVLGVANLVGDGFSMAASNYLGTRVENQLRSKTRAREAHEIETFPDGEREEIRQIFATKGFSGDELESIVNVITADKKRWIDTMLTEEFGMTLVGRSPMRAALATMVAFLIVGFIPLIAFVVGGIWPSLISNPYPISCILTATAFFLVGAAKSRFVEQQWYWSGLETLSVGGTAAALAYLVGMGLGRLVG